MMFARYVARLDAPAVDGDYVTGRDGQTYRVVGVFAKDGAVVVPADGPATGTAQVGPPLTTAAVRALLGTDDEGG